MDSLRILIVEDSRTSQFGLASFLRRVLGSKSFLVAETVHEALAFFGPEHEDDPPNVVMLDLDLPGAPGEALIEELARRGPLPHVIVTSGISDRPRIERVKSLGPAAYFSKPYDGELLLAAVEAAKKPRPEVQTPPRA